MWPLGAYSVYENRDVLPRAFVVGSAKMLPEKDILESLKRTDFHHEVLLEDPEMVKQGASAAFANLIRHRFGACLVLVDDRHRSGP